MERLIKRYPNRKLYDTEASAYVSLADIAEMVRTGETVQIVDKATGDDLTAQTLMQIMLEEGKQGRSILPTDLMHELLRRSNRALDSGRSNLEQLRHNVGDLVQGAMDRIKPIATAGGRVELEQLRKQLNQLEGVLSNVLKENRKEDEGAPAPSKDLPKT